MRISQARGVPSTTLVPLALALLLAAGGAALAAGGTGGTAVSPAASPIGAAAGTGTLVTDLFVAPAPGPLVNGLAPVRVSWSSVSGAVAYQVEQQVDLGPWMAVGPAADPSTERETRLPVQHVVRLRVRAVDGSSPGSAPEVPWSMTDPLWLRPLGPTTGGPSPSASSTPSAEPSAGPAATGPSAMPSSTASDSGGVAAAVATSLGTPPTARLTIAGDIAGCGYSADSATAALVEELPGVVMTAGDNAYPSGTRRQYRECYGPTWGRFRDRTRPTLGNHDWATPDAAGYFAYFGDLAGPHGRGYYAFTAGTWRVYALTSSCGQVGGCKRGTPQYRWLREDLAAHPAACVLAVWHHPRYSSGPHGNSRLAHQMLRLLFESGADVVVNGHDHLYERFAPAQPDADPDPAYGIRQFIVGTGGGGLYSAQRPFAPNSRVRSSTHGVLRLTLRPEGYSWRFIPVPGETFTDAGEGTCHGAPPG
jgi:hypothetical protein